MLTCKQFLQELNDYLEDVLDPKLKEELRKHVNECPNCWVVCDTTEKTLKIYKGMEAQALPERDSVAPDGCFAQKDGGKVQWFSQRPDC